MASGKVFLDNWKVKIDFGLLNNMQTNPCHKINSTVLTGWVPTLLRAGRGMSRWEGANVNIPDKKLILFSYENNQVGISLLSIYLCVPSCSN